MLTGAVFNQCNGANSHPNTYDGAGSGEEDLSNSLFDLYRLGPVSQSLTPEQRIHREYVWSKILRILQANGDVSSVIYRYYALGMTSDEIARNYIPQRSSTWVCAKKDEGLTILRKLMREDETFHEELLFLVK